ncbi:putative cell wall glucanase (Scw11) [Aspergillus homomorphus CBS 101889]|uniref:Probable beta-glucosidase btgE n=1 Tax=Aspergillus homomorphus (strain CBS 101889) TaxID=1450537 RepID=A0A395HIE8_ASPHC|nr:glycoside hydrolase [Aspergillus homomorphus CBS 101889]RAL07273.1 glycoside hydrolase [Aspergillus homomorphus CBS 101889]
MKGAFLATAAAALAGTALANGAHRRHAHEPFHQRRAVQAGASDDTCSCSTEVVTVWGTPTLVPVSTATETVVSEVVTTLHSTSYTTVTVVATPGESAGTVPAGGSPGEASGTTPEGVAATGATGVPVVQTTSTPAAAVPTSSAVALPTPDVTTFASTGVYTIPASTVTVSDTTSVVTPAVTTLPSGTHTIGGVTTVVETSTTIICPYATVKPSGTTVTSVIEHTTYYCPAAGTYTIAPTTTYVPSSTVVTYPAVSTVTPGVYSHTAEVVTVTVTDYTYTCPFSGTTSSAVAVTTPSAAAATTTVVPATTAAPATSSVKASTVSSAVASSSSAAASTGVSASGLMGMTYTPYTNDNGCKSTATITADIKTIAEKGFTHVRLYSTDCNTLETIGDLAEQLGLKLILGIYISNTGTSGAESQVTAITKWGKWELVSLVVVGNEALSSGYTDISSLTSFISSCKTTFAAAGYTGQITTTETVNIWQQYGASHLCNVVDIIGANIHPFFNSETTAAEAGKFATAEFALLKTVCSNLEIINLETGWPSKGNANGVAVPGVSEQAIAIKGIREAVGGTSVFFSYANDLWKTPGQYDVEQYWGCIDQF